VAFAAVAFGEETAAETAAYGHDGSEDEQKHSADGAAGDVRVKKDHDAQIHQDCKQNAQRGLRHGVPPGGRRLMVPDDTPVG
jgi:hypothetical protein